MIAFLLGACRAERRAGLQKRMDRRAAPVPEAEGAELVDGDLRLHRRGSARHDIDLWRGPRLRAFAAAML